MPQHSFIRDSSNNFSSFKGHKHVFTRTHPIQHTADSLIIFGLRVISFNVAKLAPDILRGENSARFAKKWAGTKFRTYQRLRLLPSCSLSFSTVGRTCWHFCLPRSLEVTRNLRGHQGALASEVTPKGHIHESFYHRCEVRAPRPDSFQLSTVLVDPHTNLSLHVCEHWKHHRLITIFLHFVVARALSDHCSGPHKWLEIWKENEKENIECERRWAREGVKRTRGKWTSTQDPVINYSLIERLWTYTARVLELAIKDHSIESEQSEKRDSRFVYITDRKLKTEREQNCRMYVQGTIFSPNNETGPKIGKCKMIQKCKSEGRERWVRNKTSPGAANRLTRILPRELSCETREKL